jgi:hypothetical protein
MRNPLLPPSVLLAGLLAAGFTSAETQRTPANGTGASHAPLRPAQPALRVAPAGNVWLDVNSQPLPLQTDAELEEFLRTARIVDSKKAEHGRYGVRKLRLAKGDIAAHAACRTIAVEDRWRRLSDRDVWFFRDHHVHEPAAYALSELLGFEMVPPAVKRSVRGKPASVQLWVEGGMLEVQRHERGIPPPDPRRFALQRYQMRLFDNLINNFDRNLSNILIDSDWRIWLIDHSRAFVRDRTLRFPQEVRRVERGVWERLRSVSDEELEAAMEPYLGGPERAALLERRRLLVELLNKKIAQLGEDGVLFSW